jgi:metal-sulfur cluster biosynthetic enzyme
MTRDDVLEALRQVDDPEIGINVVDLGLVYAVDVAGDRVRVTLTMTSQACPLGPHLVQTAEAAVRERVPGAREVVVELVWQPPWTPERMSPQARRQLGWD